VVDKVVAFIAPKIFGGSNAPGPVGGEGVALPEQAWQLEQLEVEPCGADIMLTGYIKEVIPAEAKQEMREQAGFNQEPSTQL